MGFPSINMAFKSNSKELSGLGDAKLRALSSDDTRVRIRRIPYRYQAMLAICSDLDETSDRQVYFELMRFLNTKEKTAMGRGVGLEVGNTLYFDMPANQFSYWNTDETGRRMVQDLIHSGHIDCLHSYGDLSTTREHAQRALEELDRHDCHLKVWVDHGIAQTNFDGNIMMGSGDMSDSSVYHADLTLDFGVEYVWRGRVTSIIGQNVPRNLRDIWNYSHPFCSSRTLFKEFTKGLLGKYGNEKYAMHAPNRILRQTKLRDGQSVLEFMRCNPYWGGVGLSATAIGIPDILNERILLKLIERQGFCIIYTHLGKIGKNEKNFNNKTKQAFSLLARFMQDEKILVTTTRRLLGYCRATNEVIGSSILVNDELHIKLSYMGSEEDLEGLTIYTPVGEGIKLWVNKKEILIFQRNPPDQTGQASVSLPWRKREFPQENY